MEFVPGDEPVGLCRLTFDEDNVPAVRAAYVRHVGEVLDDETSDVEITYFERNICEWRDYRPHSAFTAYPHKIAQVLGAYRDATNQDVDTLMAAVEQAYGSHESAGQPVIGRVKRRYELGHQAGELALAINTSADAWSEQRLRAGFEL